MTMKSYDYSDMTRRAPTTPAALPLAVALETCSLTIITPYHYPISDAVRPPDVGPPLLSANRMPQ